MNVVFLACGYPPEMQQYTRGLAEVGASVYGVGDAPRERLAPSFKQYLTDYLQVPKLLDEDDVVARVAAWMRGRAVDRIEANWEVMVMTAARLREALGIPGMSVDVVRGFRDKQIMKERAIAAGLRVPRSARARSAAEAHAAAAKLGYPLVLKPISGAGSADTYEVGSERELDQTLARTQHVRELSIEEFIDGEEFTFDCVCIDGKPAFMNVAQYLPKPLIARTNEWISPVITTVRELRQPAVADGIKLGYGVLSALGMGTGFTHMEWFRKPSGEVVFGEIGCRPGGAHLVDQMNYTCDIDLFREWARAVCWHSFEASTVRKYNTSIIFKRARGQGRITKIVGLREFMRKYGEFVMEEKLLPLGSQRRNWKQTLLSDGFIILRHPDWRIANQLADIAANEITMYAE
ncbi:MAG: ATP-grasp domain-containing protein [Deltaproteobacteria bacterium]|nr:ATP-grasp domain-containing protein [Deltaproteobacteria bacterium]